MIKRFRSAAAATLLLTAGASARAQPGALPLAARYLDPAAGVTADAAVARALGSEPALRAARTEVDRAKGLRLQAGLRPNPAAVLMQQTEPGGTDSQRRVEIIWPLDLFRRSGRVAVAEREIEAVQLTVADRERLLAAAVRTKYGEVAAAVRDLSVRDELVASTARQVALLKARVADGGSPPLEYNMVEAERRRLDAGRLLLAGRVERQLIELKRLLGLAPGDPLALRESIEQLVAGSGALPAIATAAARPDVEEARARIGVAEARIERATREGRFDVGLVGSYSRMDAGFPQLGLTPTGDAERVRGLFHYLSAGVSVSLPLRNRNQGEVAAAMAERSGAAERLDAARLDADAEVAAARARDERARGALAIYQDGARELSKQNLDVVSQTYELGRATVFDVLAEQRRYLEFERDYSETLREAYDARIALRRALGDVR